ncbi:MAG TPA: helix-turn-helix domain-containing protein [Longimicrobiaceae bacterium]|nr:helix-turn-helix domain-containing protein [Longimicrobiaceae bacterium]
MALRLLPKKLTGQTIRGIRTRLGVTQEAFAASLGVDGGASVVSAWERGRSQPDYGMLAKIAALGLADVLVSSEPSPTLPVGAGQVTPGEAAELRAILSRMEGLLREAREIVERAARRTPVEAEEVEVVVEVTATAETPAPPKPRRRSAAAAGGKAKPRATRARRTPAPKEKTT